MATARLYPVERSAGIGVRRHRRCPPSRAGPSHHVLLVLLVVILAQFQREEDVFAPPSGNRTARPDWNTMVTFRRMRRSSASGKSVMSSWATITRPLSGLRKPMMCESVTDFPTPLRPMMATVSPGIHVEIGIDQNRLVERLIDVPELDVMGEGISGHRAAHSSGSVNVLKTGDFRHWERDRANRSGAPLGIARTPAAKRRSSALPRAPVVDRAQRFRPAGGAGGNQRIGIQRVRRRRAARPASSASRSPAYRRRLPGSTRPWCGASAVRMPPSGPFAGIKIGNDRDKPRAGGFPGARPAWRCRPPGPPRAATDLRQRTAAKRQQRFVAAHPGTAAPRQHVPRPAHREMITLGFGCHTSRRRFVLY